MRLRLRLGTWKRPFVRLPARRFCSLAFAFSVVLNGTGRPLAQARSQDAPASIPANNEAPQHPAPPASVDLKAPSAKVLREAEDTYLRGARALDHNDLPAAERDFLRATELNPQNRDYALALDVTREHRLTSLIQQAAVAQHAGRSTEAESLLVQARAIDPQNPVVRQHFNPDGQPVPLFSAASSFPVDPLSSVRAAQVQSLGGPIPLQPDAGTRAVHARGGPEQILRTVCGTFGISPGFDSSVSAANAPGPLRLDLDRATFREALRAAQDLTHTFSTPQQPKVLFFARDTPENRAQFEPLVEETLFMPGVTPESLTEYANLARNVFNLRTVSAVGSSGGLVLRGDPSTLESVNATFADLIDGGAEVLLDLTLYEVDRERIVNLGASTPSSLGVFPVAATAENLINANQSLIAQAVANNLITLTANPYTNALTELEFLIASGTVSSSQFTNLLGVLGHYAGLPLAGVYLGQGSTFNALLNTTDARILDMVQLRAGNGAESSFRAGTRYPIETGIYSSGVSSALSSAVAGLTINGVSVSSLLSGASSVAVPQIQFEDLGLTLKATPDVLRSGDIHLKLDFKIEALGSGTINTLPILNNRALTSQITIPPGQTALLASLVSSNEQRSINGLPFLSELPGFQGTEKSSDISTTELLITLTPHIVRTRSMHIASQRLLLPQGSNQPGFAGGP